MPIIEISETTFNRFKSVKKFFSNDEVLDQLMDDQEEIKKHIEEYLKDKSECIDEIILGRHVVANHYFEGGVCIKCGVDYPRS